MDRSSIPPGLSSGVSGPSRLRELRRSSSAARSSLLGREGRDDEGGLISRGEASEGAGGEEARARPGRPFSGITSGSGEAADVTAGAGGSSAGRGSAGASRAEG